MKLALVGAAGLWLTLGMASAQTAEKEKEPQDDPAYESIRVLANAIQLIRQDYYDDSKTNYQELAYSALRGMLADLDPHSQFMDPEAFKGMREETRSEFGGLGIQVTLKNGQFTILSPMEGSPSFEAGLLPGDQILKINGQTTDRLTLPEAVELLRGEVGEKITLTIARPGVKEVKDYTLERAIIHVPSVRDAQLLPADRTEGFKIGYVRLTQFNEPTAEELGKTLDELEAAGLQALILDLRFNPGGLLNGAIDVCGEFLPAGTPVVSTKGRGGERPFKTGSDSPNRKMPLVILINSLSASGSEIVAGALKDLDRAVLIGETTFGKGSVQSVITLTDGSAIRLTTAKYLTPSKNPIHGVGVSPHIRVVLTPKQEIELFKARRGNENAKSTGGAILTVEDPQLDRAIDALKGTLIFEKRVFAENRAAGH